MENQIPNKLKVNFIKAQTQIKTYKINPIGPKSKLI